MFSNVVTLISLATLLVSGAFVTPSVMLDTRVTTPKTLRQAAERSGRYFGVAIGLSYLNNQMDPQFRYIAETQFNSITPENEQKWYVCLSYDHASIRC
jgi:endo-1,4-beta-xylanase